MASDVLVTSRCQERFIPIPVKSQPAELAMPEPLDASHAFEGHSNIEVRSSAPHWISLRLTPDLAVLDQVVDYFRRTISRLPAELCDNLALVLHELLENAMEHGCHFDASQKVELTYVRTERMVLFQIRDQGLGFSMANLNHAALNNPPGHPLQHVEIRFARGMRPGGYGIVLAKRIADALIYNEQGNEVLFIKYL